MVVLEAPLRRARRRRSRSRADPRHGGQPGRAQQPAHGAQRSGAGGGDPRGAADAGVSAGTTVDYVEAHGTGTSLGDPIEVARLGAVLRRATAPPTDPLLIGSVKTNIGHLEAAAGVAGLIKVVLALQHEEIPPHLHFRTPNPHIPWARSAGRRSPRNERPGRAASRGGWRASARSASAAPMPTSSSRRRHSRPSSPASRRAAPSRPDALGEEPRGPAGAGLALPRAPASGSRACGRRLHREHRPRAPPGAPGRRRRQHRGAPRQAGRGRCEREAPGVPRGSGADSGRPKVAFLFTGQGAQYVGMGRSSTRRSRRSAGCWSGATRSCDRCCRGRCSPSSSAREARPGLSDQTGYTQPALFALEYALAELWRSWGVEPAVVMGHSVGEYVAACVAGAVRSRTG